MSQLLNTTIKHICTQGNAYVSGVLIGLRLCKTRSNGEIDEIIKLIQETVKQERNAAVPKVTTLTLKGEITMVDSTPVSQSTL